MNAIKSVINQTLNKKYYEIIVIKNFSDTDIDQFIKENDVKHIIMDGTIGEFLLKSISESRGEILSFLDDDDLFFKTKLDFIYNEFKNDADTVYYHNRHVPINKDGKSIDIKSMFSPDFNMSCISIKKSILQIKNAGQIKISPDTLMYLYALESGKKIIRAERKLTYYMFHNSITNDTSKNFEEYKRQTITQLDLILDSYKLFRTFFHTKRAINFLNSRITGVQYSKLINGSNVMPKKLLNYLLNSPGNLRSKVAFLSSCMLIKVYPKYRTHISNKMWSIHCKRVDEMN